MSKQFNYLRHLKALEGIDLDKLSGSVRFKTAVAAALLGMGAAKLRRQVANGLLAEPVHIGQDHYFTLDSLRQYQERTSV